MSLRRFTVAAAILLALLGPRARVQAQAQDKSDDKSDEKSGDKSDDNAGENEKPAEVKPAAPAPNLKVVKVSFRGNRKVEDDAIKVNLKTAPGVTLTQEMVRDDVRAIWKMGYFEDIEVEVSESKNRAQPGSIVTFVLKEKPAINKIYVAGNDEVSLSKINEVLDIKKDQILDLAKIKKNVEKIKDAYVEKGFYMAEVSYEIKRDGSATVDVWFHIRENSKVEVRRVNFVGNQAMSDDELRGVISTQEGNILSILTSAGTYREDVFQRDLLLIQAHYWDHGYVQVKVGNPLVELSPDKQSMYITINIDEGPQYRLGKVDVTGDLLMPREFFLSRVSVKPGEIFNRSKLSDDLQKLTDYYKDRGYAYVNASPSTPVNEKTRTVDVFFEIQKGRAGHRQPDQHPRQQQDPRQGDPPRAAPRRGRHLQPVAARLLEEARQRARLLREGRDVDQARAVRRQAGRQLRGRRATHRDVPDRRRILVGRELHRPGPDLAEQPVRPRAAPHAAGPALQPPPALLAAVPGPLLPRHQLDLRVQPVQAGPVPLLVHPRLRRAAASPGATSWPRTCGSCSPTSWSRSASGPTPSGSAAACSGPRPSASPSPPAGSPTCSARGSPRRSASTLSYDSRNDRMFPSRGWYNTISAEIADPDVTFSQNIFTRYEGVTRFFYPLWGPVRLPRQAGRGPHRQPRPARRADLRALLHGRHLQHPRVLSAVAGAGHPVAVVAGPRRLAEHLPGRRQRPGHRQRRDRVPHLRQGRDPRRRVRRRGATPSTWKISTASSRRSTSTTARTPASARSTSTPTAPAGGSVSAGSRPSARSGSSGASRSGLSPASSPSSSNSQSATFSRCTRGNRAVKQAVPR